ncbi:hypothetical protein F7725_025255 [Dissostichus mawsoni]|uniref:Uncharacterized protein n=1 Tax=Dissostichus mawsoni TaxID=36200 RepID=A0A7J5XAU9_DISMA|nr:hypothetical protein F7725_025255 [Dissostichus mawsoni]
MNLEICWGSAQPTGCMAFFYMYLHLERMMNAFKLCTCPKANDKAAVDSIFKELELDKTRITVWTSASLPTCSAASL